MPPEPLVSILMLCHNGAEFTEHGLEALSQNTSGAPWEVLVLDNASTDGTLSALDRWERRLPNLCVQRSPVNLGFVRGNNQLARSARGAYLVLLNNDTEVQPGWLEALLAAATDVPQAGVVGAKLVYPNGRLQEAGGLVFQNGAAWNFGRLDDPDDPEFNYRREVDYCSGAALLVRSDLFSALDGFDVRYAPAYWEDADLCFRARARGFRVMYEPRARIVHHEGATAGTDVQHGFKRYQVVNGSHFRKQWTRALTQQPPAITQPGQVWRHADRAARGGRQTLVVCDDELALTADRLQTWHGWRQAGGHVCLAVHGWVSEARLRQLGDLGLMCVSLTGEVAARRSTSVIEALSIRLQRRGYHRVDLTPTASPEAWRTAILSVSPQVEVYPRLEPAPQAEPSLTQRVTLPTVKPMVTVEGLTFGEGFAYDAGLVRWLGTQGELHVWREVLAQPRRLELELEFAPADTFASYPLELTVTCGELVLAQTLFRQREARPLDLLLPASSADLVLRFASQPTPPAEGGAPGQHGERFEVRHFGWADSDPTGRARRPVMAPVGPAPAAAILPSGATGEISALIRQAAGFRQMLEARKQALNPDRGFWYPYDTLANLHHLDKLLQGPYRDLAALAAGRPIADIGAADGDFAFFLESMGLRSHIIDNASSNHNGLRAAQLMRESLGSSVAIHDINLDMRFDWPTEPLGLALFLGILYHLKNPYYALEALAQHAHYCLLSTKIAAFLPGGTVSIQATPVAYLLDTLECNNDPTNFWIFTERSLERLVSRTGWELVNLITLGSTHSDPVSLEADQRAFCLLRSQRLA